MSQVTEMFSFDGFGINGTDEYKTRLATLTEEGKRLKVGSLLASAPMLVETIQATIREIDNHIALHPMDKTKLPDIRAVLAAALTAATAEQTLN